MLASSSLRGDGSGMVLVKDSGFNACVWDHWAGVAWSQAEALSPVQNYMQGIKQTNLLCSMWVNVMSCFETLSPHGPYSVADCHHAPALQTPRRSCHLRSLEPVLCLPATNRGISICIAHMWKLLFDFSVHSLLKCTVVTCFCVQI